MVFFIYDILKNIHKILVYESHNIFVSSDFKYECTSSKSDSSIQYIRFCNNLYGMLNFLMSSISSSIKISLKK